MNILHRAAVFFAAIALHTTLATAQNRPVIWDLGHIDARVKSINAGVDSPLYESLRREADKILREEVNPTVTHKPAPPAGGTMNDYTSLARYWWRNPDTADGLPYVRHDGESNPELNKYDRPRLGGFAESIKTLALVYYISGDQRYADKAISRLNTWFIDPATRMNPNFNYGQIRRGHNNDQGSPFGILDGLSFVEMLDALSLMEVRGALPETMQESIHAWFAELTEWMLTSENGIAEGSGVNNHAVAYDMQIIRYALYGEREDLARRVIEEFPERRLKVQIEEDGRMPAELERTTAFGYSRYNLAHMVDICDMAASIGVDLYPAADRAIERAIDWLIPHSLDEAGFPYKQIHGWEKTQQDFARLLHRASRYGKRKEYQKYYRKYHAEREDAMFEFLYL